MKQFSTIQELGELMLETRADIKGVRSDLASVEQKVSHVEELVTAIPSRAEIGELLAKAYDLATLKAQHETMRRVIKEKLGVEV